VSERWACQLLGQCRCTQRYRPIRRIDEDALIAAIAALASHYGRYGYRRITALLNQAGVKVGKDRVRIWRREGLESAAQAAPARKAVAQRRLVRAASAGTHLTQNLNN